MPTKGYVKPNAKRTDMKVRVQNDLADLIAKEAQETGVSMAEVIRRILSSNLSNKETDK